MIYYRSVFPFHFQTTSQDVLVNVCDQVVERSSKILTQRSKAGASEHITIQELQSVYRFMEILNAETSAMTGKTITGIISKIITPPT